MPLSLVPYAHEHPECFGERVEPQSLVQIESSYTHAEENAHGLSAWGS